MTLEEFSKNKIKVGTIVEAKFISGTAKLIQLRIDLGGGQIRQSVSAISPQYAIDELFGKQVVVLTNVAPTKVHGALSEVMILAAVDNDRISMLVPDRRVQNGTSII